MPINHAMMDIGRERIFVSDRDGDLPALLFVQGAIMNYTVWNEQVAQFQQTHGRVCPDLKGFGKSSTASALISSEDHCDDLAEIVDRLSLRDIILIGWSMAVCLCQVFVARYPGKIVWLVLVDTIPRRLNDARFPFGPDLARTPKTRKTLEDDYAATCDGFGRRISPEDGYVSSDLRFQFNLLPAMTSPTAIVSGENDLICNPAASTFMAEGFPGCSEGLNDNLQSCLDTGTGDRGGVGSR